MQRILANRSTSLHLYVQIRAVQCSAVQYGDATRDARQSELLIMGHYLPSPLLQASGDVWGTDSRVILSEDPATSACLVFVHGFGGSAVDTWVDFPALVPQEPKCAQYDAFFWGYDGLFSSADFSAAELRSFIAALLREPATQIVNPSRPSGAPERPAAFAYERVIVCAHSLGAVITRRAVVDMARGIEAYHDVLPRLRLQFFAPAHKGAHIIAFGEQVLAAIPLPFPVDGLAAEAIRSKFPALRSLEVGCQALLDLEEATRALVRSDKARYDFLRAHVLHAQNDRVVEHTPFGEDHPQLFVRQHNHRSLCKPTATFRAPMEIVLKRVSEP